MRGWIAVAVLGMLAAGLAGCSGVPCTPGPLVTARGIGDGTPTRAGDGAFSLVVEVVDPTGAPLPGAGVVLYWNDARPADFAEQKDNDAAGKPGQAVEPGRTAGTPAARDALRLRTDEQGGAEGLVPSDRLVGLVAARDDMTEEWVGYIATGADGATATQRITIYPRHMEWTIEGTLLLAGASPASFAGGPPMWDASEVPFPSSPSAHLRRLVGLDATIEWTNAPGSFGNLGVGIGFNGELAEVGDDSMNAGMAAYSERLLLSTSDLRKVEAHDAWSLQVGVTADAYAAPSALAYTIRLAADFDRARADGANCLYVVASEPEAGERGPARGGGTMSGAPDDAPAGPTWHDEDGARARDAPAFSILAAAMALVGAGLLRCRPRSG